MKSESCIKRPRPFFWRICSPGRNLSELCVFSLGIIIDTSLAYTGVAFSLLTIRVHDARNGPDPSIRIPQLTCGFGTQPLSCTAFSATNQEGVNSHHGGRDGRNHRRTLSDGAFSSSFTLSMTDHNCHAGISPRSRTDECFDIEKGNMGFKAFSADAVLAMKRSSKALG